jgi:hypothetical protein
MNFHSNMPCDHVVTVRYKDTLALGVFVSELASAEAVALFFSVNHNNPNEVNITLRFNSAEALHKFMTTHTEVSMYERKRSPNEAAEKRARVAARRAGLKATEG